MSGSVGPGSPIHLLVERVDIRPDGLELRIRCDGLRSLVAEVGAEEDES